MCCRPCVPSELQWVAEACRQSIAERWNLGFVYRGVQLRLSPHALSYRPAGYGCLGVSLDSIGRVHAWRWCVLRHIQDLKILDGEVWFTRPDFDKSKELLVLASIGDTFCANCGGYDGLH